MYCKNCSNTLVDGANFCNKCGSQVEAKKVEVNIEKVRKLLKNTGNSIVAVGWLTIIINIALYIWSTLDENYISSGLPGIDLSGACILIVTSIIFIILGDRIREAKDRNIRAYLFVLLILCLLLATWVLWSGGRVGIILFVVIGYLISSLVSLQKAMKNQEFVTTLSYPEYKIKKNGWILFAIGAIILIFVAIKIDLSRPLQLADFNSASYSKRDLIDETVKEAKASMNLPLQLDEITTITDITGEFNSIRYHYILTGIDSDILTNEALKDSIVPDVCSNTDIKVLLDAEINFEYSYKVDGSNENYFVTIGKSDCI